MEGRISNFRRGRHTISPNHMIIHLDSVDSRDKAAKLVGKTVVFTTPGKKELKGTVASAHGNSGAIRVIFETGMPGQSLGQKVAVQ